MGDHFAIRLPPLGSQSVIRIAPCVSVIRPRPCGFAFEILAHPVGVDIEAVASDTVRERRTREIGEPANILREYSWEGIAFCPRGAYQRRDPGTEGSAHCEKLRQPFRVGDPVGLFNREGAKCWPCDVAVRRHGNQIMVAGGGYELQSDGLAEGMDEGEPVAVQLTTLQAQNP
jgi:hypothetical protein